MTYGFDRATGQNAGGYEMIEALRAALLAARDGDRVREEVMTERIREASYELRPRQAGYLLRSACGAIDAAMRAHNREESLLFAEHEIEKVQDMLWRAQSQPSAA